MKKLLAALLFTLALQAEDYVVVKETALTSAAEVITIQAPASGFTTGTARMVAGWVDCTVTCVVTVERNGTAATATALTRTPMNNTGSTSKMLAFSGSDVGTGTIIGKFELLNGGGAPIGLSGITFTGNGTTKNITIRISSITGTVHVNIRWTELP